MQPNCNRVCRVVVKLDKLTRMKKDRLQRLTLEQKFCQFLINALCTARTPLLDFRVMYVGTSTLCQPVSDLKRSALSYIKVVPVVEHLQEEIKSTTKALTLVLVESYSVVKLANNDNQPTKQFDNQFQVPRYGKSHALEQRDGDSTVDQVLSRKL